MGIIKNILKRIAKIIHFRPYSEWTEEEKLEWAKNEFSRFHNSYDTTINPASGLPMIGALDSSGNSFGSSSSYDYHRRSNDDYYRSHSSINNNSTCDPFTNRY